MKISFVLFVIVTFLVVCSCTKKDWLDAKPSQDMALPSTLKDFQAIMDNTEILNLNSPGLGEVATPDHYVSDSRFLTRSNNEKNAYTWSHQFPYLSVNDWRYPSTRIFYCNIVLEGVLKIKVGNANEKSDLDNIKGQALFHRAKSFYEMAEIFSRPYRVDSAQIDLGLPLRLESDINVKYSRSSVQQTYSLIINDLQEAEQLLPITPVFKTRPSKPAALALLAKIYLNMQNYVKAGEYADKCLKLYNELMDYNDLDSTVSYPIRRYNPEVIFHNALYGYSTVFSSSVFMDTILYASYSINDLRKVIFFRFNTKETITFKGTYTDDFFLFGGLATDEVYFIRAECNARTGKVEESFKDLNYLLSKRWKKGTYKKYEISEVDDPLGLILNERKKELIMRGIRWSDLRRLNKDPKYAINISKTVNGSVYTLLPNDFRYTFPIPDDIIQATNIIQNIGWE